MKNEAGYLYLNLDDQWPTFERHEVQIADDGALRLNTTNDHTFVRAGVFRGGSFEIHDRPTAWRCLRVYADPLPEGAHVQLFTFAAQDGDAPYDPTSESPFPGWHAAPRDVLDILIPHPPARYLWVGGLMLSDGWTSPALRQMRLEYGESGYLGLLPALYRSDERQRGLLNAVLSLHESVLGGLEEGIDDLPQLFDPWAASDKGFPSWLSWLAAWLAFDLNEAWSEDQTRRHLAQAFDLYGKRGTMEGLRRYLKIYAGTEAHIEEPGLRTHLWSLGETSTLGFTTMLAPAELQGAVLGRSAALDRSHVTDGDDFGAALFEDLAHRFCVGIYCAELTRPGALADVHAVIEREKPAHTTYHLCLIDARMRVGVQARVGIDAIIAGGPSAAQVGRVLETGVLTKEVPECEKELEHPDDLGMRVSSRAHVGIETVVGRRFMDVVSRDRGARPNERCKETRRHSASPLPPCQSE